MIKMGKIQNATNTFGVAKKPYVAYGKKREGKTSDATAVKGRGSVYRVPYQQVVVVSPIPTQQSYTIPNDQRVVQQPAPYQ